MPLAPGKKLGPYEIVSPLGAGGMGEVYRAKDTRLDRTVAIKILPSQLSSDPVRKQRFEREAKTISSLNHPNICVLYDVGHQDGTDYLVMECVEGETLAKRLEKGPLPLEQVLKYGAQIADAMDKAHRSGVVHRDLKPSNIMLTPSGAKLLDFGLAKPAAPLTSVATMTAAVTQDSPVTERGTIVGTFQYMSPEQVEGKELDARSDIFSLGAVLYEMVTGQRAFQGKSQLSVASAILEKEPTAISSIKPMTPPTLDHAIRRCLAKDPEERWQTAHDLSLELKWVAESASQRHALPPIAIRGRKREHILWVSLALLLILCAILAVVHFGGAKSGPQTIHAYIPAPEGSTFAFVGDGAGPLMISPDGTRLVFAARDAGGKQLLWLRPLRAASSQALAGTEGGTYPFWSADSRFIGFFADGKLKKIAADGGPTQALCDAPDGRGGSWNREGSIIFAPALNGPLYKISAGGGTPAQVTQLDPSQERSHRFPQFLPDGQHFLYTVQSTRESPGIYVGSLDQKGKKLLLRNRSNAVYATAGYLLFETENTLMAQAFDSTTLSLSGDAVPISEGVLVNEPYSRAILSVSENGVLAYGGVGSAAEPSRLSLLDRAGKQIRTVGDPSAYWFPRLSPDATKLAVTIGDIVTRPQSDIWVYDLVRGGRTRLTFGPVTNYRAIWSPDGDQIVFSSNRTAGAPPKLYRKGVSGQGGDELLLDSNTTDRSDDWSPDGKYIVYEPNTTRGSLWLVPTFGDRKPVPFLSGDSGTFPAEGAFSHDGKWLAFTDNSGGKREVLITSFPEKTGKWQVSLEGGRFPRWRGDDKELFFLDLDNNTMMSADLDMKSEAPRVGIPKALFTLRPGTLVQYRGGTVTCPFDVSFDGKRFLVNAMDQPEVGEPINLIVNWDVGLKKK